MSLVRCGTICLGGPDHRAPDRRVDPWRAVRRLVTILRREAAAGYPQCYCTLRCLLRGRGGDTAEGEGAA